MSLAKQHQTQSDVGLRIPMWGYELCLRLCEIIVQALRIPMWGYEIEAASMNDEFAGVTNPHVGL